MDAPRVCHDLADHRVRPVRTPVSADAVHTDTTGLDAGEVKVPVKDGAIPAYRAIPDKGGPFATVLIIHEAFGVHEHIQDLCRRLAKLGLLRDRPRAFCTRRKSGRCHRDIKGVGRQDPVPRYRIDQAMSDLDADAGLRQGIEGQSQSLPSSQ